MIDRSARSHRLGIRTHGGEAAMTVSSGYLRRTFPVTSVVLGMSLLIVLLCTAQTSDVRRDPNQAGQAKLGSMDWPVYRGDPKRKQYSPVAQINQTNVH